ncbi:MAG TPA: ATP-binding protein [Solirubrobacterales bacterium]|nr:ATP-binding protein [Solirubrobacterales bacterium]
MTTFSIDELNEERLEDAFGSLSDLVAPDDDVVIELKSPPAFEPMAIGLLHWFFLADRRSLRVTVSGNLADAFPSLGLASAISRATHSVEPKSLRSTEWTRTWTPGSRRFSNALFSSPDEERPEGLSGPEYATFNDPHLTFPVAGNSGISSLIRRWLFRRLEDEGAQHVQRAVERAGFFVSELVGNIREHAVLDDRAPLKSQVWIRLWKKDARRFFSVCISDTGPGIESTLRAKLGDSAPSEKKLFEDLLSGDLPGWGRARGIGLSKCYEIVEETQSAAMLIASGEYRCHRGAGDGKPEVSRAAEVEGTLVVVTLPV